MNMTEQKFSNCSGEKLEFLGLATSGRLGRAGVCRGICGFTIEFVVIPREV